MIQLIESAAGLHTLMIDLDNEGRTKHAQVLRKTIELELRELWGEKDNGEIENPCQKVRKDNGALA